MDYRKSQLIIRPERVMFSTGEPLDVSLPGKVVSVTYLGERIRFSIRLSEGISISAVHPNTTDLDRPQVGESIKIGWNSNDVSIIPDERG